MIYGKVEMDNQQCILIFNWLYKDDFIMKFDFNVVIVFGVYFIFFENILFDQLEWMFIFMNGELLYYIIIKKEQVWCDNYGVGL